MATGHLSSAFAVKEPWLMRVRGCVPGLFACPTRPGANKLADCVWEVCRQGSETATFAPKVRHDWAVAKFIIWEIRGRQHNFVYNTNKRGVALTNMAPDGALPLVPSIRGKKGRGLFIRFLLFLSSESGNLDAATPMNALKGKPMQSPMFARWMLFEGLIMSGMGNEHVTACGGTDHHKATDKKT